MSRLLLVLVLLSASAWATPASPKKPALKVEDTQAFFARFFQTKQRIKPKSEFETEVAYRKRLPAFDSQQLVHFLVEPEPSRKSYSYDTATQTLTLEAGSIYFDAGTFDEVNAGRPDPEKVASLELRLARRGTSTGSYMGENAFGVRRQVKQATRTEYVLHLSGPLDWWQRHTSHDYLSTRLRVQLQLDPQAAQRLARSYQLLVGAKLKGPADSTVRVDAERPTLTSPEEISYRRLILEAALQEILLRDRFTQGILKTIAVAP